MWKWLKKLLFVSDEPKPMSPEELTQRTERALTAYDVRQQATMRRPVAAPIRTTPVRSYVAPVSTSRRIEDEEDATSSMLVNQLLFNAAMDSVVTNTESYSAPVDVPDTNNCVVDTNNTIDCGSTIDCGTTIDCSINTD